MCLSSPDLMNSTRSMRDAESGVFSGTYNQLVRLHVCLVIPVTVMKDFGVESVAEIVVHAQEAHQ